jgi:glycosyltransferase involved in cell wall biosynthesis
MPVESPPTSKISIVIPVYNGQAYLERAIESALGQTRPPSEIVIADDASTDGTPQIINRYENHPLVRVLRLPDRVPAAAAWNKAIRFSTAPYFCVLAHDDLLHPDFIAEVERSIDAHPRAGLIVAGYRIIDAAGRVLSDRPIIGNARLIGPTRFDDFFQEVVAGGGMYFCDTGSVIARTAFDRIQGFDERFQGGVYDFDFFLRLATAAPVFGIANCLADYRIHASNMSAGLERDDKGDGDVLFSKLSEFTAFSTDQKRLLVRNMSNFQFQHFTRTVVAGDASLREILDARSRVAARLRRWAASDSPFSRDVLRKPPRFNARLAWFLGGSIPGVAFLRMLTRIIAR